MRVAERPFAVLVVDHDPADLALIRHALRPPDLDATLTELSDARDVLAAVRGGAFDCLLLAVEPPGNEALGLLREMRQEDASIAIVLVTRRGDEQLAVELMKAGATDYVARTSLSPTSLRHTVLNAVRVGRAELAASAERRRLARLHGFLAALATKRSVAEVADVIVIEGRTAFTATRALFGVVTETGTEIEVLRTHGYDEQALFAWRRIPMDAPLPLPNALRTGEPSFFEDAAALMAAFPHLAAQRIPKDEALFVLPLLVGQRAIGVVALISERPRATSSADRDELRGFATLCAQALDRAQLFDLAQLQRRLAEEASRAKDEFLAVVSHELRTPLNAMLGWAKLLNSGTLTPEQEKRATATIERNAVAQAQLIEDILDVSRIITGQLRIEAAAVDVPRVIEEALEVVRPAADAKGVRLELALDRQLGPVLGDAKRLQQVFWNLLSNAVKFTPAGGHVAVRLERVDSSYNVTVEDSGQGMTRDFLPHVFERFLQEDTGPARRSSGLGLGLAIVRHIVELHGGRVQVHSAGLGRGATFTVQFPGRAALPAPSPAERSEAGAGGSTEPPRKLDCPQALAGLRVLVVDDEPDARELVAAVLTYCGADVITAGSAAHALRQVQSRRPDVLISDIGMPNEDGYTLIQQLRALPSTRGGSMPAIALTAYARSEDRSRALAAGYTVHVAKPLQPSHLTAVVASLVGSAASPGAGRGG